MARPLWTGSVSFGLVNVPVSLFSAVVDQDVHFTQLHGKDGAQIETRRFCSKEDKEVPWETIGHGYELDGGKQVVLTDEDLATVAPRKTRTIDIASFVDLEEIDPVLFDHPYFLAPAGETEGALRAYRLLVDVMSSQERAAIGRFVMRTREYLVAIRAREERLTLTTLLFHDEIRDAGKIAPGGRKPAKKKVDEAVALVEEMTVDWDPGAYEDRFRKRLLAVIRDKKKGKTIKAPAAEKAPDPAPDLMAALRESLELARSR
jgi:DNA end-binding protein Ku